MKITTPNGTMTLADDARPSIDDQNDIIASVTRDDAEFQALCDAAGTDVIELSSNASMLRDCERWIATRRA